MASDKLREQAKQIIAGKEHQYKIDRHETTGKDSGEGAFPYEVAPDVSIVVIDKGSGSGYVQITGGGMEDRLFLTGPEQSGIEEADIYPGQTCMIFGCSTVLYIRPRKGG